MIFGPEMRIIGRKGSQAAALGEQLIEQIPPLAAIGIDGAAVIVDLDGMGNVDGAVEEFRAVLQQRPDRVATRHLLGTALMAKQDWAAARAELSARLHSPVQIRAGDSVFELLTKLADCGLELAIESPLRQRSKRA